MQFGPWFVDGPSWNQIVWSDAETRVCFLAHSNGKDDARDIARGHLIAAAPELLEVAKRILDRGYISEHIEEERGDHQALKAAIAKAEGRS